MLPWAAPSSVSPKVFLLDEPLSNLDAKLRVQMRTEITKLHQRLQTTFIYVTHDQTEAMTMGSRIVVMKDGFVQQVDTPQNLYDYPANLFVAGFIGSPQMNFFNVKLVKRRQRRVRHLRRQQDHQAAQGKLQKFVGRVLHRQGSLHGHPSREHPRRGGVHPERLPTAVIDVDVEVDRADGL